jgi:hypothetical protein
MTTLNESELHGWRGLTRAARHAGSGLVGGQWPRAIKEHFYPNINLKKESELRKQ